MILCHRIWSFIVLCFIWQQLLNSLYFRDGKRRIDFVLVVHSDSSSNVYRETFEKNLEKEGLELEYEPAGVFMKILTYIVFF